MKDEEVKNTAKEPITEYDVNSFSSIEQLPTFGQVIEKSIKEADAGLGIPHEEVMKRVKEKYPFLK